jgi:hypothetical protein
LKDADLDVLSPICPEIVATALNNLAVLAMTEEPPNSQLQSQQTAAHLLHQAIQIDPWSILVRRNLAWLTQATTVDDAPINMMFLPVMDLATLQYGLHLNASQVLVEHGELQTQFLHPWTLVWS